MNQNLIANGKADCIENVAYESMCESCIRAKDPTWKEDREFLSFEELSAAFETCVQHLQKSECHEELTRSFVHEHRFKITQCICLAIGNFGISLKVDKDSEEFTGPLHQLAVLTILLQVLETKHDIQKVYFQDPNFQPVEIQFLESLGYTVLDDPDAFAMMSASTFLFAPYCPDSVMHRALQYSFPALYIGNGPRETSRSIMYRRIGLERLRAQQVDTFFRFDVSTKGGESMMPALDQQEWLTKAQIRWLRLDYKKFEKGVPVAFFFLFRMFVFLLLIWKRVRSRLAF